MPTARLDRHDGLKRKLVDARNDPTRRGRKVDEWPVADRLAWEAAKRPGNLLKKGYGRGCRWSDETTLKLRTGYGRWLTFLNRHGWLDLGAEDPALRITRDCVAAYIEELQREIAP